MAADMRLPTAGEQISSSSLSLLDGKHLVVPGDVITSDTGFMRGHGTYMDEEKLTASVAGEVERVNKLICVRPLKTRFNGEVGDVVVGRITERRRSAEDELSMRDYLQEGDLISAEVQSVFADGALSLHTRSLKYGKLGQGVLVLVSPSLVKRQKTHFHNLPCGASIILGSNGYIWLYPTPGQQDEEAGGYYTSMEPVPLSDREVISRLRNCLLVLAAHKILLYDTSVLYCFESSLSHQIKDILKPEVMDEIVMKTRQRLMEQEG
ncbi:exosome complex component RRP4 isoform X3 [Chanos chanos]|uniref:Exosome complex component RRP4 isoform X3 n=1 Tax=Chanos chanos TaxID=29144 RepID=A0A6J2UZT1_CHACN|nr:exosome complex component RRP4 isoform X3 [Chanos chanos]